MQSDEEEGKERSKEQIGDRKARRRPRSVLRECAERSPTSVLVAAVREPSSCTSGSSVCTPVCPASGVHPGSVQHRRRRFSLAICLIKAMVSAATLGLGSDSI